MRNSCILFTLNSAGDVTTEQTGSNSTTSTYIGHRLHTQRGADGITMRFIYDSNGNLACKVPEASWQSTACPAYTTWPTRNAPLNLESYLYDYKNRLTAYRRYGNQGQLIDVTTYTYDALDRTVSKTENHCVLANHCETAETTTTNSSYEGDSTRVIEENLLGLEKKTYAYDAFGEALSLSQKPNSQAPVNRYSYLHDPGSSVSLLVDSQGAVKESYAYTAYGSPNSAISKKATGFSQGSVPTNPVRFQGKRFDSGSGSYDMGARRYSASAGRWLQQDFYADALDNLGLSQDPLTANRYAFLGANPVNYVEWDGHFWREIGHGFASGAGSTWRGVKRSANDPIGTYKSVVKTSIKDLSCTGCAIYGRIKGAASTIRSEYASGGAGQVIGRGLFEGALLAAPYGGAKAAKFLKGTTTVTAGPTRAYSRRADYGHTPTRADRRALGATDDHVVDHQPTLVERFYEGDRASREKPGYLMTPQERLASGSDRGRMRLQSKQDSARQGGKAAAYSKRKKTELGLP